MLQRACNTDRRDRGPFAVLVAEIVKNFHPRLVELHNYRCRWRQ